MKHIYGDIFLSNADAILHQVNCQGVMGSGVAKQVREKYPIVVSINHCGILQVLNQICSDKYRLFILTSLQSRLLLICLHRTDTDMMENATQAMKHLDPA